MKRRDRFDLALDVHELGEFGLVVADRRVGGDEPLVLHVLVLLPEPVVLPEVRKVLEHLKEDGNNNAAKVDLNIHTEKNLLLRVCVRCDMV